MVKYFEDWVIGEEYVSAGRTVTESDVVLFASMTGDNHELHTNEVYSREKLFGTRVVHGLLALSIAQGLFYRSGFLGDSILALLEINKWKFNKPIYFGDTIFAKIRVREKRISKTKTDCGILVIQIDLFNQDRATVQTGIETYLVARRKEQ